MNLDALLADAVPQDWRIHSIDATVEGSATVYLTHRRFQVYAAGAGRTLGEAMHRACRATVGRISEAVAAGGGDVDGLLRESSR